jgi:CheY-like chemotaxis protein
MNILIIEDDLMVRKALSHTLLEKGHTISIAVNGHEAIAAVEKNSNIDLIICDVMMPVLTGPTFLLKLKSYFPKINPAIVIISGDKVSDDFLRKLEIPFDFFLSKPIDIKKLDEFVERVDRRASTQS